NWLRGALCLGPCWQPPSGFPASSGPAGSRHTPSSGRPWALAPSWFYLSAV
ncbi:unnamed protein product, partial [Symbiodinium sp. KB8]